MPKEERMPKKSTKSMKEKKNERRAVAAQAKAGTMESLNFIPKKKEEESLILGALQENPLFQNLVSEVGDLGFEAFSNLTAALIGTMSKQEFSDGQNVMVEGDIGGDKFYVISKGSCGVFKKTNGEDKRARLLGTGSAFGELALLYSCPRNATIKAQGDTTLWVLEQSAYNTIKRHHAEKLMADKLALIDSVPSFKSIAPEHRAALADVLEPMTFEAGEFIMHEGEVGDRFYIVQKGEVVVESGGVELVKLSAGAFFGERALINDDVRQADVRAIGPVFCLSVNRKAFLELMGPIEDAWKWDSLRNLSLFGALTDKQITELAGELKDVEFQENEFVFNAGDSANGLYLISSGAVLITDPKADGMELARLEKRGECFGELALLNSEPRAANVKCLKKGKFMLLTRDALETTIGTLEDIKMMWREDSLRRVPLFSKLTPEQRKRLARSLQVQLYEDGQFVIKQGETGDTFYILERGTVAVKDGDTHLKDLHHGAFFGELALLKNDVRAVSCISAGTSSVLCIDKDVFEAQLGPLQDILETQAESYDSVGQKLNVKSFADLQVKAVLGMGAFGKVMLVSHAGINYALKCLMKQQILEFGLQEHMMQERNIMMDCHSTFLVNLVGTFQEPDTLYMIMETVMGGELFTFLQNCPDMCVPEPQAAFYAACTVQAFEYLQDRSYIHRDLKPENLLMDKDGYLKLADFGFAKRLKASEKTFTTCGTPDYMAPELLKQSGHTGAVDWWALGVMVYEMITGICPFYADDEIERYKLIQRGKVIFPNFMSPQSKDLVKKLCNRNTGERLGVRRSGAKDVKKHPWFKPIDWTALGSRSMPPPYVPDIRGEDDTTCFDEFDLDCEHPGEAHAGGPRLPSMGVFDNF